MDQDRYAKAIKASALDKDINNFPHGDLTEIGQRGINMSGGQKQRIQLARAIYNDADIYLLDDPFSAVDAHTASTLFHDCVMAALEKKTVILVTHQVEFLSAVDKILVMENGSIGQCGNHGELLTAGTAFEQLVNAHKDATTVMDPASNEIIKDEPLKGEIVGDLESNKSYNTNEDDQGEVSAKGLSKVQLTEEEEKETGDVGLKPYLDYIVVSKGLAALCIGLLAQLAFVAFQAASTYWLVFGIRFPDINSIVLVGVYTGFRFFAHYLHT
ncbi:ATP-binding cassette sub- C member 8 [Dionaea muscipula]